MNTDRLPLILIAALSTLLVAVVAFAIIFIPADAPACPGGAEPLYWTSIPVGDTDVDVPVCE